MNAQFMESVENATTFGDVFDLAAQVYDSWKKNKTKSFELCKVSNGWSCKVMEVRKVEDGKDFKYKKSFVLKETGTTAVEAFKLAARKVFG